MCTKNAEIWKVFPIAIRVLLEATISGVVLGELQKIIFSLSPLFFLGQKGMPAVHSKHAWTSLGA
jgi:hypothetical protein